MAGSKFQYDESGGTFFYFLLSFEALVVIPCTYYFYPTSSKQNEQRDRSTCHCDNCCVKNSRLRSKDYVQKTKQRFIKLLLLIGWLSLGLTFYKVANLQHDYVAYDPFEILQIETDASMTEIKKAYRRLSLVYHPDKETGNEQKFMMIAKAYTALTDDEARKNWEMYGNPDGPGATSFGIALPSWIVEKENSIVVLGLYALVFMVALPVGVGIWWYRSVKFGGDQVLYDTTQLFFYFIYKTPHMIFKRVIMIIAASLEFEKSHNSEIVERPSDNLEIPLLIKELSNLGEKNKEKPLCFGYSIKARTLLHAHLSRLKLSKTLEEDRLVILKKCPYLIQEFVSCIASLTVLALAGKVSRMPSLDSLESAMKLCACIVQGLWDNKSSLLQLPHITEEILRHFTTRRRNIRSIWNLACMQDDERRAMLRSLNDDQYDDVMNVIAKMPVIEVQVKSEVLDDEDSCTITAGAIVTVTATLFRRNMSTKFFEQQKEFLQDEEGGDSEQTGTLNGGDSPKSKKPRAWEKQKKKKSKGGGKAKKKAPTSSTTRNIAATKKPTNEVAPNGVLPSPKVEEISSSKSKPKDKEKETRHSGHESDSSDSISVASLSAEENDDVEEDAEWEKFQQKVTKKDRVLETKSKKSHSVHCPYFPEDKQEHWWVYLADKRRHALITVPYLVTNLVETEEVELKFAAPPKPGIYTYSVVVRSDSYIDFDEIKTIQLDVKEAKEIDMTKVQWDVSEEEEEKDEESAVEDSDLATDDEIDDE